MKTIKGTVKNGQVALSEPIVWPEGTEVGVSPTGVSADLQPCDDEQAEDADQIARWIAEFDSIPPLQMTPAEEAEWQASRRAQREFDEVTLLRRVRGVEGSIK